MCLYIKKPKLLLFARPKWVSRFLYDLQNYSTLQLLRLSSGFLNIINRFVFTTGRIFLHCIGLAHHLVRTRDDVQTARQGSQQYEWRCGMLPATNRAVSDIINLMSVCVTLESRENWFRRLDIALR